MIISAGSCERCICPSMSMKHHSTKNAWHKITTILKLCIHKWLIHCSVSVCQQSQVHRARGAANSQTALLRKGLCSVPPFWEAYSDRYRMCVSAGHVGKQGCTHADKSFLLLLPLYSSELFNIVFSYHLLERQSHVQCYIIEKSFCRSNNLSVLEILIIQHAVEEEGNEQYTL